MERRVLEFGDLAAHDFDRECVNFRAVENGIVVKCSISEEALQEMTGSTSHDPAELVIMFEEHAFDIGEIAEEKLNANALEPDGSIFIRAADIR